MKQSALQPEDIAFCQAVDEFCQRNEISHRKLGHMCTSPQQYFSKSNAFRLRSGEAPLMLVRRMRPILFDAFADLLTTKGLTSTEVEAELSTVFEPQEYNIMIANRCPLTPEAVRYFGFKYDPFDVDRLPVEDEVFTNPELDSVSARVRDAVLYQRFVAIIGGVGSGKTLLKLRVAGEVEGHAKLLYPEFFDMSEVTVHGIANKILAELGQKIPQNKEARVSRIREVLTQMQLEGTPVAIVLDECHRLQNRVVSSLKNFWEMTNGRNARLLGVLLFGQPAFVDSKLREVEFKEIRQRVQIIQMPELTKSTKTGPADISGSSAYIQHRINVAGGSFDQMFEPEAIRRICLNAQSPLALGNLANEALMEAFRLEEKKVQAGFEMFKKLGDGRSVVGIRRSAA